MLCYTSAMAMMTVVVFTMLLATTMTSVEAFAPTAPLRPVNVRSGVGAASLRMVYVPDGLTLEQWKKIKTKEQEKIKEADLGRVGVRGFQSRSLQAWQEAGARHLFPVNPKKVSAYLAWPVSCIFIFVSPHACMYVLRHVYCRELWKRRADECPYQLVHFFLFMISCAATQQSVINAVYRGWI